MYNSPNVLFRGLRTEFFKQLAESAPAQVKDFAFFATSEGTEEKYLFLSAMPGVKEWIDSMNFSDFKDYQYVLVNKKWYIGIRVDRDTLNDSKKTLGGDIEAQIKQGISDWQSLADKLINELLQANGNAFDGTAFFATSRPNIEGTNAINNIYSGTGITEAQIEADIKGAIDRLLSFKDKKGEPIHKRDELVVYCPVHLFEKFNALSLNERNVAGTNTNTLRGRFKAVKNFYQDTSDNDWYLINKAHPIAPFIYQSRKTPELFMDDNRKNVYIDYFSDSRANAGYANPTAIVKVNN